MSYDTFREDEAERYSAQASYRRAKARFYHFLGMHPQDPDRPDQEDLDEMREALEDCF